MMLSIVSANFPAGVAWNASKNARSSADFFIDLPCYRKVCGAGCSTCGRLEIGLSLNQKGRFSIGGRLTICPTFASYASVQAQPAQTSACAPEDLLCRAKRAPCLRLRIDAVCAGL